MHFGPYTPNGLTFDFQFHHVVKIEVGPVEVCRNFATRRIELFDADGQSVVITCFTHETQNFPVFVTDEYETKNRYD